MNKKYIYNSINLRFSLSYHIRSSMYGRIPKKKVLFVIGTFGSLYGNISTMYVIKLNIVKFL